MSSVPPVSVLQQAFLDNLECIRQSGTLLQPSNGKQLDILKQYAQSSTLTLNQLGALVSLSSLTPNRNAGLDPIKPLGQDPLFTSCSQFGTYTTDWYFLYAQCNDVAFTMCLFNSPVCNPKIAAKYKLALPDAHVYFLGGGITTNGGAWTPLPPMFLQGQFQCPTQGTFSWVSAPQAAGAPIQSVSLQSPIIGTIQLGVSWLDSVTSQPRTLQAVFTSPTAPYLNGPKGCQPLCLSGVGSLYWSYTNMDVTVTTTGVTGTVQGKGWMDHQWLQGGKVNSNQVAALTNLTHLFSKPTVGRWLWINIQDEDLGQQYMIYVPLTEKLVQQGDVLTPAFVNQYDNQAGPRFWKGNTTKVTVNKLVVRNNYTFPLQYTIDIAVPSRDQVKGVRTLQYQLTSLVDQMVIFNPMGAWSWEGPGVLVNTATGKSPGYCFLEANFALPSSQFVQTAAAQAGLSATDATAFAFAKTSLKTGLLSVSLFLAYFVAFVVAVYLVVRLVRYYRHKRQRQN